MEGQRAVGVAVDFSPCSKKALEWAVDNLIRDGDHLILVNVQHAGYYEEGEMQLWEATGSPDTTIGDMRSFLTTSETLYHSISSFILGNDLTDLKFPIIDVSASYVNCVSFSALIPLCDFSDPKIDKKYGVKPDAETLDILNRAASQKEIVVVLKIYWGDPREKICEAIENVPLSCLVVGSRGLGPLKRAILGSVSNHVVNNGTCPVTVVKH